MCKDIVERFYENMFSYVTENDYKEEMKKNNWKENYTWHEKDELKFREWAKKLLIDDFNYTLEKTKTYIATFLIYEGFNTL